jgi:hypothetical protein
VRNPLVRHLHCTGTLFCTGIAVLLATVLPAPAAAQEGQSKQCVAAALPSWTPQEVWVWKRICGRQTADLNDSGRFGPPTDIDKPKSWSSKRVLRSSFIETVLTDTHYSDLLTKRRVTISGAWFRSPIDLANSSIPVSVHFWDSRFDKGIDLGGADISGTIAFGGSRVRQELNLNGAKIGQNVFLRDGSKFKSIDLVGADIGGDVDATSKSTFTDELDLFSAKVKGSVYLYGSHFASDVICSGVTIEGVLGLYGDQVPTWDDSSEIDLEGGTVKAIDDAEGAWPKHVRLSGLVIQQAHGKLTGPGQGIMDRPTKWYHEWLSRDEGFSRESYKQLEAFLRNNGRIEAANEIAMARVDHEYALAGPYRKVLGFFHHYIVGYGYHPEWSIFWIISLIAIGAFVARWLPEPIRANVPSLLVLSAQRLIPLIDFGKTYSDVEVTGKDVPAGVRRYFYVHAILGYILAAFIIAAIARVTTT